MGSIEQPSKEQVRAWLSQRRQQAQPLPNGEQIRRQLGWEYHATGRTQADYKKPIEGIL